MKHIQIFQPISCFRQYTLYCDGSHRPLDIVPSVGIGAELRDQDDNLILTFSQQIPVSLLPPSVFVNDTETFALTKVLEFCYQEGVRYLNIMTDSDGLCVKIKEFVTAKIENKEKFLAMLNSHNNMKKNLYHIIDKMLKVEPYSISRTFNKPADFYSRNTEQILQNHSSANGLFKGTNSIPVRIPNPSIKDHTQLVESFIHLVNEKPDTETLTPILSPLERKNSSSFIFVPFDSTNDLPGCNPHTQMSIDIQDLSTHFQIKVFKPQKDTYNYYQFKQIVLKYPKKSDRYFALLFVLFNLISGKSSINLLEQQNYEHKIKMLTYNYTHHDWKTFQSGEVSFPHTKIALTKKLFNALELNLANMNGSHANLGDNYPAFFNCLYQQKSPYYFHKTFHQAALYWSPEEIAEFDRRGAEQHIKPIANTL